MATKKKISSLCHIDFTTGELKHLRDLMSVILPSDSGSTVSETLAVFNGNSDDEESLWNKLHGACNEMGLPIGDSAPDFAIVPIDVPAMGVVQIAKEEK